MNNQDRLYQLLEIRIEGLEKQSNPEDLIYHTVGDYIAELFNRGHIPYRHLDYLEEFLREETDDILKKLTYGSLSFQDYLERRKIKRERAS